MAFSKESKRIALENADYKCERCGATEHLEASHIDHTKNANYDDPYGNCEILCISCHLQYHIESEGNNGLNSAQNDWSIRSLRGKLDRIKGREAKEYLKQKFTQMSYL